jgi:hypothetical protein
MDQRRRESRFRATFPVEIEPAGGITVDMSGTGIAFITEHPYEVGDEISLRIIMGKRGPEKQMELECRGRIVRVERADEGFRVGASVEWSEDDEELSTTTIMMG